MIEQFVSSAVPTYIKFHDLTIKEVDGEHVVGRSNTSCFISLDETGLEAMLLLKNGHAVDEVEKLLSERVGQPVGVLEFVDGLLESHLIAEVNGIPVATTAPQTQLRGVWSLIKPGVARPLFSPTAWICYGFILIAVVGLFVWRPRYFPGVEDFFPTPWLGLSLALNILGTWLVIFLHELGHVIAARAEGLNSVVRFNHRLVFLVIESEIGDIWTIPRSRRYSIFGAGVVVNVVLICLGLIIRVAVDANWVTLPESGLGLVKLLIFLNAQCLAMQAVIFLQTDLYFVLTTLWQCSNLNETAWLKVKRLLFRLTDAERRILSSLEPHEDRIGRWYAFVYALGTSLALFVFFRWQLPLFVTLTTKGVSQVMYAEAFTKSFWDGFGVLACMALTFGFYAYYLARYIRKWLRNRRAAIDGARLQATTTP